MPTPSRATCTLLLLLLVSRTAGDDKTPRALNNPRQEYLGRQIARTMHFQGAPWLVRESRSREEEPAQLLAALRLARGQVVADIGCGNGFYSLKLAAAVGPKGAVWAVDIQPEMLEMLAIRAEARGLTNVRRVEGAVDNPRLPRRELDLILLVDAYHEFSHPVAMLAAMRESLKPTGRVALVEFRAEDPAVPIRPLHKMTQRQCLKEFAANGFKLVGQHDALPWQHVLFFTRDDSPLKAHTLLPWEEGNRQDAKSAEGAKEEHQSSLIDADHVSRD